MFSRSNASRTPPRRGRAQLFLLVFLVLPLRPRVTCAQEDVAELHRRYRYRIRPSALNYVARTVLPHLVPSRIDEITGVTCEDSECLRLQDLAGTLLLAAHQHRNQTVRSALERRVPSESDPVSVVANVFYGWRPPGVPVVATLPPGAPLPRNLLRQIPQEGPYWRIEPLDERQHVIVRLYRDPQGTAVFEARMRRAGNRWWVEATHRTDLHSHGAAAQLGDPWASWEPSLPHCALPSDE